MATSGSFATSSYAGRHLVFSWSRQGYSIENNNTTISWTLTGAGGDTSLWYMSGNFRVVIAGSTVYSSAARIQLRAGTVVASGTYTITHRTDGSQSFSAYAEAGIYTAAVNCTGSGSWDLETIPRKSTLTVTNGTLGKSQTLTINRAATIFTHTLTYKCGSATGTIATKTTSTSIPWTPPLSLASQNKTGASVLIVFTLTTYNGSSSLGTSTNSVYFAIPESVAPTCTLTLEDVTGAEDIYGSPVQGVSKIKITVTPTIAEGSPVASYKVTADGNTYTEAETTTEALANSGSSPVAATVTDQRNRSGAVSHTMQVLAYNKPSITRLGVHRCNQDGTPYDRGEYVQIDFDAVVTSLNNLNTAAYVLRYKKSSSTSYTEVALTELANVYEVNGASRIIPADSSSTYDVEIVASDRHSSTTRSTSASTGATIMNFNASGNAVAFGKVSEYENSVEIDSNWSLLIGDAAKASLLESLMGSIYPVGSVYISYSHTDPATLFGGTWERITNAFLWPVDEDGTIGETGGERTHTLTVNELPNHNLNVNYGLVSASAIGSSGVNDYAFVRGTYSAFSATGSGKVSSSGTGGGQAFDKMPPYVQVSMWRRTA